MNKSLNNVSGSMVGMLDEMQGLVESSNLKKTTIQYFRDNFESIEKIIELNNMYDISGKTGLTAYKRIAESAFKDGVMAKDGSILKESFISSMLNTIRKERGLVKTKTVPLAVSSVVPDVPNTSKTELKSFADAVDLVLDEVQSKELHRTNYEYIDGNLINIEKIIGLSKHLNYQFNGVSVYDFISDIAFNNGYKGKNGKKMQAPYLRRMIKLARQNRNSRGV